MLRSYRTRAGSKPLSQRRAPGQADDSPVPLCSSPRDTPARKDCQIAGKCPVHRTLEAVANIKTVVKSETQATIR
ncbi:MAG: hypothetical protein E5Y79_25230 [Mesorhizobium sp.]|nr:MAG: hypothetical protein E5Y79_25230 [Mesorhizobium sp.]